VRRARGAAFRRLPCVLAAAATFGCAGHSGDTAVPPPPITEVLATRTPGLLKIAGVSGTGQGNVGGRTVFVIYVTRRTATLDRTLPRTLDGWPVDVREVGEVRAFGDSTR